jgi:uncharacterized membrane protein YkoI
MFTKGKFSLPALIVVTFFASSTAPAQQLQHPGYDTRSPGRTVSMSLDEATARVRDKTGGQVLSAREYRNGERYYRFKVKKQGRVRVLYMRPDGSQFNPRR